MSELLVLPFIQSVGLRPTKRDGEKRRLHKRIRLRWAISYRIYIRDTLNWAAQQTLGDNAGNIIFKLDGCTYQIEEDAEIEEDETMGNFIDIE